LVATLPLLDAVLVVIRRVCNRASPFYGDRLHIYDLLLARGWSPRRVALACYAITAAFSAIAWWGVRRESPQYWFGAALSVGLLLIFAVRLGSLRPGGESPSPQLRAGEMERDTAGLD
jgi:hypothetical protein